MPAPLVSKKPAPTIDDFLDHIDYIVKLVGVEHVGLGLDSIERAREEPETRSDFSRLWHRRRPDIFGPETPEGNYWPQPEGIDTVAKVPNITKGLAARDYSDDQIQKILGGNWLRIYEEVWGG